MKQLKLGVILLALLLAAMAMVPMVSAEENSECLQLEKTTAIKVDGNIVATKLMDPEFSVKNVNISREEFVNSNAGYIAFLKKKFDLNQSTIDKIIDREYNKNNKPRSTASVSTSVSSALVQIGGNNIYIWPYTNTGTAQYSSSGSINLIFYGMTKSEVTSYMKNSATYKYHQGTGWTEYGYRGSSTSSMSWTKNVYYNQLEYGSYLGSRYHLILLDGGYSSTLGKYWSYGQTHYEYWSETAYTHYLYSNAFNTARSFICSAISSSKSRSLMYLYNYNAGIADGYGYVFKMA